MAKQMVFDDEARQPLLAGVSKLARAVRSTLGPRGRNAVAGIATARLICSRTSSTGRTTVSLTTMVKRCGRGSPPGM